MIQHDKKNTNKIKNDDENDNIEQSNNEIKDQVKNARINYSPKEAKSYNEMFIKYNRRKPE